MNQIVVGRHHLTFCSHGKKYKMGLTLTLVEKTIILFVVMDFVRYSEGQKIQNTIMTQKLLLNEVFGEHTRLVCILFLLGVYEESYEWAQKIFQTNLHGAPSVEEG